MRYFDGALAAPPACADISEPRDKIDTIAATVRMFFAMRSSIWLQQINLRVSDARHRDDPVHRPCRTEIVEHRTLHCAPVVGSRLDPNHVLEPSSPGFHPTAHTTCTGVGSTKPPRSERTAPPDCEWTTRTVSELDKYVGVELKLVFLRAIAVSRRLK